MVCHGTGHELCTRRTSNLGAVHTTRTRLLVIVTKVHPSVGVHTLARSWAGGNPWNGRVERQSTSMRVQSTRRNKLAERTLMAGQLVAPSRSARGMHMLCTKQQAGCTMSRCRHLTSSSMKSRSASVGTTIASSVSSSSMRLASRSARAASRSARSCCRFEAAGSGRAAGGPACGQRTHAAPAPPNHTGVACPYLRVVRPPRPRCRPGPLPPPPRHPPAAWWTERCSGEPVH